MGLFSRYSNAGFQERTATGLKDRTGCSSEVAHLAAIGMHPFDSPPQSQEFEKYVRKLSRRFAVDLRRASTEDEVLVLARQTVRRFRQLADEFGEHDLADAWSAALLESRVDGAHALDAVGLSSDVRAELDALGILLPRSERARISAEHHLRTMSHPARGGADGAIVAESRVVEPSMREEHGVAGALLGSVLASLHINLYVGVPAYLLVTALVESVTLLPDTRNEVAILIACLLPGLVFVLLVTMTPKKVYGADRA